MRMLGLFQARHRAEVNRVALKQNHHFVRHAAHQVEVMGDDDTR